MPALVGIMLFIMSSPAYAGAACYNATQLQAEHMLRLHSELMVITVTCRVGSEGQDLVSAYTGFTKRNIGVLHDAEHTMANYYNANGGNGIDRVDKLRTLLGNEYGQKIADMSAPAFCAAFRDMVLDFAHATPVEVSQEVERMKVHEKSYIKMCEPSARIAKETQ